MDLFTYAIIATFFYLIYYYFKTKLSYFERWGIPYLPGWPILGNMAGPIFRRKHFNEAVRDIYNVHPTAKYVGGFDFNRPVIVLRDLELIKTVGIKNFECFPDHNTFIDVTVDPIFGGNLFNMRGDIWREARNVLTPSFTSSKMKGMFELMIGCGKTFTDYIYNLKKEELKMVDTKNLFTRYTNDVIATCAFGVGIDSLNNPNNEFYVYGRKATNLEGLQTIKFFLIRSMPKIAKIIKIKLLESKIESFFKNIVGDTVKMRDEKGIHRPDMIQLMMDARKKNFKNLKMDVTEMTAHAFIFFFAGFETTSSQMCIITHELAINPDVQSRLQEEIDDVLRETNGKATYEAINEMPYLDAVFNESMRLHTQVAFLDRLCMRSFELPPAVPGAKPFRVPIGMNVWIPSSSIHRDSQYYEDPEKFDPDRYYQKKVTINDVLNLGFGIGPRSCIGNRFAILETKILIFFLLAKFNLKPNAKTCIPLKYNKKVFTLRPEEGYWLEIEPRNK